MHVCVHALRAVSVKSSRSAKSSKSALHTCVRACPACVCVYALRVSVGEFVAVGEVVEVGATYMCACMPCVRRLVNSSRSAKSSKLVVWGSWRNLGRVLGWAVGSMALCFDAPLSLFLMSARKRA